MSTQDDNIILFSCTYYNKCYQWGGVGGPQDYCVTHTPFLGLLGLGWDWIWGNWGLGLDNSRYAFVLLLYLDSTYEFLKLY